MLHGSGKKVMTHLKSTSIKFQHQHFGDDVCRSDLADEEES